jgi:cytochrome c biogenesis protein CcmG/thiol:disulfide interchange protein DsbE
MTEPGAPAPRRRPWLWAAIIGIVLGVGAMVLVFSSRFGLDPRLIDSPLVGQPLPAVTLEQLNAEGPLALGELRGEVLVVNFWASWCFPCEKEHPALTAAARDYRDRGVTMIGIANRDSPSSINAFLDEFGRGGENYRYALDPDSRVGVEFGLVALPETYFVDAEGTIVGKIQGEITYGALSSVLDQILAGERPSL